MAIKLKNGRGYKCLFCEFTDVHSIQVEKHQDEHNPILLPMTKEELATLMQYFYTKDDRYLNPLVVKRMRTYLNNFNKHKLTNDNNP